MSIKLKSALANPHAQHPASSPNEQMKNLHLYKKILYPFSVSLDVFLLNLKIQPRQAPQVDTTYPGGQGKKKPWGGGLVPKRNLPVASIHPLICNRQLTHSLAHSLTAARNSLHPETFSSSKQSQLKRKLAVKCFINALICYSYFFRQDFVISNVT